MSTQARVWSLVFLSSTDISLEPFEALQLEALLAYQLI